MSDYSCLSILKSKAKELSRVKGIKRTDALEIVAKEAQFSSYHELSEVAKRDPMESRLVFAALGETSLEEAIFNETVFSALEREVEEQLSGDIAETNADGFTMEDLEATKVSYNQDKGILSVTVTFEYQGDQYPDRAYSGTSFGVEAEMELLFRNYEWSLVDDSLTFLSVESDVDRDWYDDLDL